MAGFIAVGPEGLFCLRWTRLGPGFESKTQDFERSRHDSGENETVLRAQVNEVAKV
jgi:hypothetical protein